MAFDLIAYDKLKQSVKESIKSLIEHHHPTRKGQIDINKLGDAVKLISTNPEGRGHQSEFLLEVIKLTDAIDDVSRKTLILNAAVYHIHRIITATYRSESAADSSTFNFALKTSLELHTTEEKKKPNDDDKYTMYKALVEFLEGQVFRVEHNHMTYVDRHPFVIAGYDVGEDIKDLTTKIHDLKLKRLDTAKRELEEATRPAATGGLLSFFGLGGGSATATAKKPDEVAVAVASHNP